MNRSFLSGLLPVVMCLSGCGDEGVGGGTFGGVGTTSILYVSNSDSSDVSGFTINGTSGVLAAIPGSPFSNVAGPSAISVSSNGFFAYVANSRTNTVTAFRVSTEGGLLLVPSSAPNPNPASAGTTPGALAISPDTKFLYVANSGSDNMTVFSIGTAGALSPVPQTAGNTNPVPAVGADPASIAIASNGKFLYLANSGSNDVTAFAIQAAGLVTLIQSSGANTNPISTGGKAPKGIVASPDGSFLYVANSGSNDVTVFQIGTNGLPILVPSTASSPNPISVGGTTPNALIISQSGQFLYATNGGGNVTAFTVRGDGLLTLVPSAGGSVNPVPAGTTPVAMTISPDGRFLYVANRGGRVSAYTITEGTGALVPLSALVGNPFLTGTTPSGIATPGRP